MTAPREAFSLVFQHYSLSWNAEVCNFAAVRKPREWLPQRLLY